MKKIVECQDGTRDYNVGDVVYLNIEDGKPTCMAEAVKNSDDVWLFKPLNEQSFFFTRDGLIPFGYKPYIFAKQVEVKEEQP